VCDLETSRMGAPYIYDISRLRVNDLTLILLTRRKWWAPNNASRQQMGFNSGLKGLNLEKTLSPPATEAGMVNHFRIETVCWGRGLSFSVFFVKFKIISGLGYLNFCTKLCMLIRVIHEMEDLLRHLHPNQWLKPSGY